MAKTPHDVFISYSSKDKAVGDAICAILERRGVRCWIAPRDIVPGDTWARSIIQAINGAKVFVLIFTDSSNHSAQVEREVERAAQREMPIIPFRVENIAPNETLEYFISSPHWMDAISPPLEQHIERLAGGVRGLLDRQPPARTMPGVEHGLDAMGPTSAAGAGGIGPASTRPPTSSARKGWVPLAVVGALAAAVLITWLVTHNHPSGATANSPVTAAADGPSAPPPVKPDHSIPVDQSAKAPPAAPATPVAVAARAAPPRVEDPSPRAAPQAQSAPPPNPAATYSVGSVTSTNQTGGTTTGVQINNSYGAAP